MAEKEYIEKGELLKTFQEGYELPIAPGVSTAYWTRVVQIKDALIEFVKKTPPADVVEVVHAAWIPHEHVSRSPYARNYDCSACGNSPIETGDFCNKCGAKMDGGERNELRRLHTL